MVIEVIATKNMSKHHVVIVGGGFGGIQTALKLLDDQRFIVTLISDRSDFHYYPMLYKTATGGRRKISSIPLTDIFSGKDIRLLIDKVTKINRQNHTILTKIGYDITYDALVLGLGAQTNYYGIEGLKELSYGIKTPDSAERLKRHIHKRLLTEGKPDKNYVVVGGGPTGVELAGALGGYIKEIMRNHGLKKTTVHIDLIEAAPRLLPRAPKDISLLVKRRLKKLGVKLYLNTAVQAQTADSLMVHNKAIRSHTVIWTAGVTNNSLFLKNKFQMNSSGKVRVDQFLQSEPGIYVIGDNADTPYSGMAQTALHDGAFVAKNLQRIASHKEPEPYIAKRPVYVYPAGKGWAAVHWKGLRLVGFTGWILRSIADLIAYNDFEPWQNAVRRWLAQDEKEENCAVCVSK